MPVQTRSRRSTVSRRDSGIFIDDDEDVYVPKPTTQHEPHSEASGHRRSPTYRRYSAETRRDPYPFHDRTNKRWSGLGNARIAVVIGGALFVGYENTRLSLLNTVWLAPLILLLYILFHRTFMNHTTQPYTIMGYPYYSTIMPFLVPRAYTEYDRNNGKLDIFYVSHEYMFPLYAGMAYSVLALIMLVQWTPAPVTLPAFTLSIVWVLLLNIQFLFRTEKNLDHPTPHGIDLACIVFYFAVQRFRAYMPTGAWFADLCLSVALIDLIGSRLQEVQNGVDCHGVPTVKIECDVSRLRRWSQEPEQGDPTSLERGSSGDESDDEFFTVPSEAGEEFFNAPTGHRVYFREVLREPPRLYKPPPPDYIPERLWEESFDDTIPRVIDRYLNYLRIFLYFEISLLVSVLCLQTVYLIYCHFTPDSPDPLDSISALYSFYKSPVVGLFKFHLQLFTRDSTPVKTAWFWGGWVIGTVWVVVSYITRHVDWIVEKTGLRGLGAWVAGTIDAGWDKLRHVTDKYDPAFRAINASQSNNQ